MTLFDQGIRVYKVNFWIICLILFSISFTTFSFVEKNTTALNDDIIVVMNSNVIFDALENDVIGESLPEIGIINQPQYGSVILNSDLSFTYTPQKGICEYVDSFMYFIAKDGNYDKATVYVDILCEPLTFISGFSLDQKASYNSFTIIGIENYPNNSLHIFDKWGNEVFYTKKYENDWNGSASNKQQVEDIFYYVFFDGLGNMYSGNLQLSLDTDSVSSR